jgi:hypothetical protein
VFRLSKALYGWEKLLYIAATARRWVRTLRASSDRAQLGDCLRRGWRDGWLRSPRTTREVLRDTGVPVDVMIEVERLSKSAR